MMIMYKFGKIIEAIDGTRRGELPHPEVSPAGQLLRKYFVHSIREVVYFLVISTVPPYPIVILHVLARELYTVIGEGNIFGTGDFLVVPGVENRSPTLSPPNCGGTGAAAGDSVVPGRLMIVADKFYIVLIRGSIKSWRPDSLGRGTGYHYLKQRLY
ncbi:uncharacterized protein [Musca autumnalis]|uniref:uncharacterized protein n=1 Tax=Musca autumnalis TaxID=221902 RepID=UPI003CEE7595